MNHTFQPDDRVVFSREFLRNTGQFTGPDKPCHHGPFASGVVTAVEPFAVTTHLVAIKWDDGHESRALNLNLIHAADRCRELV
jgi:hypothetical protein